MLDRGFIFGDGVYEVVPVYGGIPFCFDEHMARLDRSLAEVRIVNPLAHDAWRAIAMRLIDTCARRSARRPAVYIQVTRGVAVRDHAMPEGLAPTVFVMFTR